MQWKWILLGAALAVPATADATAGSDAHSVCEAAYAELAPGAVLDLLDPAAPLDRRASALEDYERLSKFTQCPEFGYTLGQLYRHGSYLPGNLVAQDIERARELIRPMAEDGYLPAFADLAEMEMRHANARAAMQWTQVYLHFVEAVQADYIEDAGDRHYQRTAYNSHLLGRTDLLWRRLTRPRLPDELMKSDLATYLAEHGDEVRRRMHERMQGQLRRMSAHDGGPTGVVERGECVLKPLRNIGSASASWIVEVLPSGRAGRVVLENLVPNVEVAREMERCLAHYKFAAFEGDRPTTVRISMVMGSTEGRALSRPRRR